MEFVEGKIVEEKVFGGAVFPKTLNPPLGDEAAISYGKSEVLIEMIKEKREWLSDLLKRHLAILFRGFNVSTPEEFRSVVEAFGWDEMPYMGPTHRTKVTDRVYTANQAPVGQCINFHHEMFLIKQQPSKIFFYCEQPASGGGETSILPSHIIVSKMEEELPEFVADVEKKGYVFIMKTAKENHSNAIMNKTWNVLLETEDQAEAENRAKEKLNCNSVNFNEDGSAEFVYGPLNPIRNFVGKRVWFNPISKYSTSDKDITSFGDGSSFPAESFDVYRKITEENNVDVKWEKGDVLLLDNLSVQHARRPGKPSRVVLVAICK